MTKQGSTGRPSQQVTFDSQASADQAKRRAIEEKLDPIGTKSAGTKSAGVPDVADVTPGRNDPCPCGSGQKFKKCCVLSFKAEVQMRAIEVSEQAGREP
jgi:uncharacterized protein YchJ